MLEAVPCDAWGRIRCFRSFEVILCPPCRKIFSKIHSVLKCFVYILRVGLIVFVPVKGLSFKWVNPEQSRHLTCVKTGVQERRDIREKTHSGNPRNWKEIFGSLQAADLGGVESLPPRALNGTEALRRNWVAYEIKNSLSKGSTGSHTSFGLLGNPYIASVKKYLLIEIFGFTYKKTKNILTSQHSHKHFLKVFYHLKTKVIF